MNIMLKVGILMVTLVFMSGCTAIFGEDEEVLKAQQQAEQAKEQKQVRMQAELERLRAEVRAKKIELESIK